MPASFTHTGYRKAASSEDQFIRRSNRDAKVHAGNLINSRWMKAVCGETVYNEICDMYGDPVTPNCSPATAHPLITCKSCRKLVT